MGAGARSAGCLAAVAAPEAPAQLSSSLTSALKRDTAVLEVDNPAAPDGTTKVPSLLMKSLSFIMLQKSSQSHMLACPLQSPRQQGVMRNLLMTIPV